MYISTTTLTIKKWDLFHIMNIAIELPVVWPELDFAGLLLMVAVFLGVRGSLADGWPVLVGGDCQEEGSLPQQPEAPGSQEWQRTALRHCCTEGVSFGLVLSWWLAGIQGRCAEGQTWYRWAQLEEYRSKRSDIVSFINIDISPLLTSNSTEVTNPSNLTKVKSPQSTGT